MGRLPSPSMAPRAQTGLLSPAPACLSPHPGALSLHHKPPDARPHPARLRSTSFTQVFFPPRNLPAQPSSLQDLPPPFPSLYPRPVWSGSTALLATGCSGHSPQSPSPSIGQEESGQRWVGRRERRSVAHCSPCSPLQDALRGLQPLCAILSPQASTRALALVVLKSS